MIAHAVKREQAVLGWGFCRSTTARWYFTEVFTDVESQVFLQPISTL
jgi:hypothetical protein